MQDIYNRKNYAMMLIVSVFIKNPVHAKENIEMQFNVGKHTSPKRFYSICFYMKIFQVNIKSI